MKLYPFQEECIEEMKRKIHDNNLMGIMNCCEQGLGKTAQAINYAKEFNRIAVICPAGLMYNWKSELEKWGEESSFIRFDSSQRFLIGSYYDLRKHPEKLYDIPLVIIDESHHIKTPRSKVTKSALKLRGYNSCKILLLTGTPIKTEVSDLWSQFFLLGGDFPRIYSSFYYFNSSFVNFRDMRIGSKLIKKPIGIKKEERELLKSIYNKRVVRRTKAKVLSQLPEKNYNEILIPCEQEALQTLYHGDVSDPHMADILRSCALYKLPFVFDYTDFLLSEGEPVLLWYHHKLVGQKIVEKYSCEKIDGSTPPSKRSELVERFQNGSIKVLALQIQSAGTGLTLTRSRHSVFVEQPWTYAERVQAEDRIHRIGQTERPTYSFFVLDNDLEIKQQAIIKRRKEELKLLCD